MSTERLLVYEIGKELKKTGFVQNSFKQKLFQTELTKYYTKSEPKGEYPSVYPLAKDDPKKLSLFLNETYETLDWVMNNWSIYIAEKNIPKKPFSDMWKISKTEFEKIIELVESDFIKTGDIRERIDVEKELTKKGLTKTSLESKLLLVDFGHIEMLLAYDDYENSSKTIQGYSTMSKIAKKLGPQILKIRKLENQVGLSKWLGAAIIIIGSLLDALGIKSTLTEYLDLLALSVG